MIDEPRDADVEEISDEVAVAALPADEGEPDQPGASWQEMFDNRLLLLSMLFFVTAGLGIPFLWKSRAFSTRSKWLLTVVVLAHTVFIFWLFWLVMKWCYDRIMNAL